LLKRPLTTIRVQKKQKSRKNSYNKSKSKYVTSPTLTTRRQKKNDDQKTQNLKSLHGKVSKRITSQSETQLYKQIGKVKTRVSFPQQNNLSMTLFQNIQSAEGKNVLNAESRINMEIISTKERLKNLKISEEQRKKKKISKVATTFQYT